jgi:S-adenosylmethionine:tRNA ribosyltransferase-isomerase
MKVEEFDYYLPEELIAQEPAKKRNMSRLMVIDRAKGRFEHRYFKNLDEYINDGDCIVLNDTKVIPVRLYGKKIVSGGKIEFLLLNRIEGDVWEVMLKPGKRAKKGAVFVFGDDRLSAEVMDIMEEGNRIVEFKYEGVFEDILQDIGNIPIPPYIKKTPPDITRYQTVYSKNKGSAAAPTAGLHFTDEMINRLKEKGVIFAFITLHVGIGTFRPVKEENVEDHKMHPEYFIMNEQACKKINTAKKLGKRVIATGTTSCRAIEAASGEKGEITPYRGWTDIFIYPGYKFKTVDALITNFHLPRSSLLMLVCAFADRPLIFSAYKEAIGREYRFYSFGDAMFIL